MFKLMADVALRPAFKPAELEVVRRQTLSGLAAAKEEPEAIASRVSSMLTYGKDHPYGEQETEASVKAVTAADLTQFHSTWWKPNIAYLVFVGDITVAKAQQLATQYFGAWPKGNTPAPSFEASKPPAKTFIAIIDRPNSVQSVINFSTPVVLKPGTPDAIPASLMNSILGSGFSSRLVQNLREKYGFTYGASSSLRTDKLVGAFSSSASVRNEKTDSAIAQFLHEFNRIRNEAAEDSEVVSIRNYMSGAFARSLENPATIANFALNRARYNLPADYYKNYLTTLNSVDAAAVRNMAQRYIPVDQLVITIVGNAKQIAPGLEKYGEVRYFDAEGNPTAAPVVKSVDAAVTPESIFKKAIDSYGGEAALAAIKDLSLTGTVYIMGQQLTYRQMHVMPDGFSTSIGMGDMTIMKQSKNGTTYSSTMQGQSLPVSDDDKADLDARASLAEELLYVKDNRYKFDLKGIEAVDGKDAYHVRVTSPSGSQSSVYYDVASGMKVQEVSEKEGPQGKANVTVKYLQYGNYHGTKLPVKIFNDAGMMKFEITITDVKVNQGLKVSDL